MWDEYQDLTPEERLDKIVEILTEGVLRIIDKKNTAFAKINTTTGKPSNSSGQASKKRIKDVSESP